MEEASVSLFWASLVTTAVAVLFYWGHAFGVRVALRGMATTTGRQITVATLERVPEWFGRTASLLGWIAAGLLALSLFARWQAADYAPWSNMWEYTVAFSGGILFFHLGFERWSRERTMGAFLLPVALALMMTAAVFFPSRVRPLVPALQNLDILAIHVGVLVLAYGAFSVSFAAAVAYLVQGGDRNRFERLPNADALQDIAFKSVALGFPLLTAGIALGAYWANSAWGRYWGWDPKETSILVSWLIYGTYLHTYNLRRWSGGRSNFILVAGYASILFSYFAVNLFVAGLHSYAGV